MNIIVHGLDHVYPASSGRKGSPLPALQETQFQVASGSFVALIGPSGCGKSTLLRLLAGLLEPTRGSLRLDGEKPTAAREARKIAWLAQNPALLPWLDARQNIALVQKINTRRKDNLLPPEALLELVGLQEFASAYPFTFSGGMQHRLALARTLALSAPLWLMDEPFASLDELTREALGYELRALWQRTRPTVIWVTHSIPEAVRLADRVLVLSPRPGRIVTSLSISLPYPRQETSAEFVQLTSQLRAALRGEPSPPINGGSRAQS